MRPAHDVSAPSSNPGQAPAAPRMRRRVRVALNVLRRVAEQRARFASDYGQAATPEERFVVAVNALRAAAATGAHQVDPEAVAVVLERLTAAVGEALTELHNTQEAAAEKTIAKDKKRIEDSERRRHAGAGNHPQPERPGGGNAPS